MSCKSIKNSVNGVWLQNSSSRITFKEIEIEPFVQKKKKEIEIEPEPKRLVLGWN